jgi:hypothetical protein
MPYNVVNLMSKGAIPTSSLTGQGGQPNELYYTTDDAIATVEAANYFNPGAEYFGVGINVINVVSTVGPIGRKFVAVRVGNVITLTRFTQAAAV